MKSIILKEICMWLCIYMHFPQLQVSLSFLVAFFVFFETGTKLKLWKPRELFTFCRIFYGMASQHSGTSESNSDYNCNQCTPSIAYEFSSSCSDYTSWEQSQTSYLSAFASNNHNWSSLRRNEQCHVHCLRSNSFLFAFSLDQISDLQVRKKRQPMQQKLPSLYSEGLGSP